MQRVATDLFQSSSETDPQKWQGHLILCGVNNLAYRIIEQLSAVNIRVVVLDDEPEERPARLIEKLGVLILREDSRLAEVLVRAGIRGAAALITVENNDLHNLETVLAANEVAPGIRTVASFFNQEIGRQLVSTVKNARSVSLSEKAGPGFITAALPGRLLNLFKVNLHQIEETVAVAELTVRKAGTLGELFPKLTLLALRPAVETNTTLAEAETEPETVSNPFIVCPPKATPVKPGDRVTVVGWVEDMHRLEAVHLTRSEIEQAERVLEASREKPVSMRAHRAGRFFRAQNLLVGMFRQAGRPLRYAILALLILILVGTVVFEIFYHPEGVLKDKDLDLITSLYFTVTVVTTTGFGDFNLATQPWPLKLFGIILMLSGTSTVAVMFAFLTNAFISLRLDQELGRKQATGMQNHIIMCGLGTVGYKMLKGLLERGEQVVVIERNTNDRFNPEVRTLGVPVIQADSRLRESLLAANINKARCIAVMTSDDLANLETALVALNLRPTIRVVLRLFDRNLADKVERNFNIHMALSASALAAPAFIAEAFNYQQLSTFYVERVPFTAAQEVVQASSHLSGLTIGALQNQTGVQVLAHLRQPISLHQTQYSKRHGAVDYMTTPEYLEPTIHPPAELLLNQGDTIIFIGPYDRIIQVHQLNIAGG
jgi:Trk K+ transport system NAD-binding subunit